MSCVCLPVCDAHKSLGVCVSQGTICIHEGVDKCVLVRRLCDWVSEPGWAAVHQCGWVYLCLDGHASICIHCYMYLYVYLCRVPVGVSGYVCVFQHNV